MKEYLTKHLSIIAMAVVVALGTTAIMAWATSNPADGMDGAHETTDTAAAQDATASAQMQAVPVSASGELSFVFNDDIDIAIENAKLYLEAVREKVDGGKTLTYNEARDVLRASLLADDTVYGPEVGPIAVDSGRFALTQPEPNDSAEMYDAGVIGAGYTTTSEAVYAEIGAAQFAWSGAGGDVCWGVSNRGELLGGSIEVLVEE